MYVWSEGVFNILYYIFELKKIFWYHIKSQNISKIYYSYFLKVCLISGK
jgi:hypothetical protein